MDDDLEAELMDLAINENAYLPQAAHSLRPVNATTLAPSVSRSVSGAGTTGGALSSSPSLRARPALPAALVGSYGAQSSPLQASAVAALPSPPSALVLSVDTEPLKPPSEEPVTSSFEEPPSWYDQIEMVLATAETKYLEWLEALEIQGSVSEEELRAAEQERVRRRSVTVGELKARRRATVHAKLVEISALHRASNSSGEAVVVDVDKMMDKLARVVDESAKQLVALRGERLWTRLFEDLPHEERDYVAKGSDEMFIEKLKYKRDLEETSQIVELHFKAMFQLQLPTRNGTKSVVRTMNHSLGQTLREFAEIFHCCYGDPAVQTALTASHTSDSAAVLLLPLVAADINQFAAILVQVVLFKYPELVRSWSTRLVHRCVVGALFEHLQPTLHALYIAAFAHENAYLSRLSQQLRSSSRMDRFGVKPVFRLDGSWSPTGSSTASSTVPRDANELQLQSLRRYEPLIARMNTLPSNRSPWVKSELIAGICRDLDRCIKAYYAATSTDAKQRVETNMAADDLAALLSFLLVAAPAACSHIATQLALLGSFMVSESAMGEEGFAVATLWTAVSHLCYLG